MPLLVVGGSDAGTPPLARRLAAETLGTGLLVTAVVGSGIAAGRLSPTDVGLQLAENAAATGAALAVIILLVGRSPAATSTRWSASPTGGSAAPGAPASRSVKSAATPSRRPSSALAGRCWPT